MPDISDISSQQYIFSNMVLYITILMESNPPNLEKVEQLGSSCLKRAQTSGNELVIANIYLSLGILTTHLATINATSLTRSSSAESDPGMVRSASSTNLSHFQQIQQRKQLNDLVASKSEADVSVGSKYYNNWLYDLHHFNI